MSNINNTSNFLINRHYELRFIPEHMQSVLCMVEETLDELNASPGIRENIVQLTNYGFQLKIRLATLSPELIAFFETEHYRSDARVFSELIDNAREGAFIIFHDYNREIDKRGKSIEPEAIGKTFLRKYEQQIEDVDIMLQYCEVKDAEEALQTGYVNFGEGVVQAGIVRRYPNVDSISRIDGLLREKLHNRGQTSDLIIEKSTMHVTTDENRETVYDFHPDFTKLPLTVLPFTESLIGTFKAAIIGGIIQSNAPGMQDTLFSNFELPDQEVKITVHNTDIVITNKKGEILRQSTLDELQKTVKFQDNAYGSNMIVESHEATVARTTGSLRYKLVGCDEGMEKPIEKAMLNLTQKLERLNLGERYQDLMININGARSVQGRAHGRAVAEGHMTVGFGLQWLLNGNASELLTTLEHEGTHERFEARGLYERPISIGEKTLVNVCQGYLMMTLHHALTELEAYAHENVMETKLIKDMTTPEEERIWLRMKNQENRAFLKRGLDEMREIPFTAEAREILEYTQASLLI